MTTIRPETLVRWHRAGFRRYWRWKSRNLGVRPPIHAGLRALIRRMSIENTLWGAPRIHGELLKLGFAVAQSTVAKYMASTDGRPSGQHWGTFLRNHLPQIAAMDLLVVPTIGFNLLYVLVHCPAGSTRACLDQRDSPTAEWIAQQITEAFPWNEFPRYLIRDRDGIYGGAVTRRLRAMGHPRQTDCSGLAVAEFVCRAVDWNDPSRVRGPHRRAGRGASASDPGRVRSLLQYRANAPFVEQRCAALTLSSANRTHPVTFAPRRTASPIRPNLSFVIRTRGFRSTRQHHGDGHESEDFRS